MFTHVYSCAVWARFAYFCLFLAKADMSKVETKAVAASFQRGQCRDSGRDGRMDRKSLGRAPEGVNGV